jgi:hypothetical protein
MILQLWLSFAQMFYGIVIMFIMLGKVPGKPISTN